MQKDIIRKRSSSPKLQVHNPALINAQSEQLFEDVVTKPEDWGRTVESAIGAHLMNHSHTEGFILHYWRERNDENVSFLGLLSKDAEVKKYLSDKELKDIFDYSKSKKNIDFIFQRVGI